MPSSERERCPECAFSWTTGVDDAIAMVAGSPSLFSHALGSVDPSVSVGPGVWTPGQYLWHMVDVLRIGTERLWTLTVDAGATLPAWDENELAKARDYADLSPTAGVVAYAHAAEDWVQAARQAPPEGRAPHPELGTITTTDVVLQCAHEAQHHLLDMEQMARGAEPPPVTGTEEVTGTEAVSALRPAAPSGARHARGGDGSRIFDDYVMVDWSANSTPRTGKDSIWVARGSWRRGTLELHEPTNPPTRHAAMADIDRLIAESLDEGRRLVIGFDFPLSYPAGLVESFPDVFGTGPAWQAIWRTLSERVQDAPDNANNRWEVARSLNRDTGCRLFWGCPDTQADAYLASNDKELPALEERGPRLDRFRQTERRAQGVGGSIQSVWKLAYAGSVGSQALLGIPHLQALRARHGERLRFWPLETGISADNIVMDAPVTVAEIWPTVFAIDRARHPVRDAAQVLQVVESCALADTDATLIDWLAPGSAEAMTEQVAEEGWILGVT